MAGTDWYKIVQNSSAATIGLAFFVALLLRTKIGPTLKLIGILIWVTFGFEVVTMILWAVGINNLIFFHLYNVVEFALLSGFFIRVFKEYNWYNAHFYGRVCQIIGVLFTILNSIFVQLHTEFNSYGKSVSTFLLVTLALTLLVGSTQRKHSIESSYYYIGAGILVYYSSAFGIFLLSNYTLVLSSAYAKLIWALHAFLCIVLYLMFMFGLWKSSKTESWK